MELRIDGRRIGSSEMHYAGQSDHFSHQNVHHGEHRRNSTVTIEGMQIITLPWFALIEQNKRRKKTVSFSSA